DDQHRGDQGAKNHGLALLQMPAPRGASSGPGLRDHRSNLTDKSDKKVTTPALGHAEYCAAAVPPAAPGAVRPPDTGRHARRPHARTGRRRRWSPRPVGCADLAWT